jgi:hypothetical protein
MTESHQGMAMGVLARLLRDAGHDVNEFLLLNLHDAAIAERWTAHEVQVHVQAGVELADLEESIRLSRGAEPGLQSLGEFASGVYRAAFATAKVQSKALTEHRRKLVLSHPDLAAKLCSYVVGYSKAENWNGWIPPELDSYGARSDSPRRAALVAILAEAELRTEEAP